jgi:hypothetical protein
LTRGRAEYSAPNFPKNGVIGKFVIAVADDEFTGFFGLPVFLQFSNDLGGARSRAHGRRRYIHADGHRKRIAEVTTGMDED